MAFDPTKFGAVAVQKFDPSSFGATPMTPKPDPLAYTGTDYGATFPSDPNNDSALGAGAKAVGNIPSSAYSNVSGFASIVAHPFQTLDAIGNSVLGGLQKGVTAATGFEFPDTGAYNKADTTASAMGKGLSDRYGSIDNLQRTATNDPLGFGMDIMSLGQGASMVAGKSALAARGMEAASAGLKTVGSTIAKPLKPVANVITDTVPKVIRSATSQVTGLDTSTISQVLRKQEAFSKEALASADREVIASSVKQAINERQQELSDLGSNYKNIRETTTHPTDIPEQNIKAGDQIVVNMEPGFIRKILTDKFNIKIDAKGNIPDGPSNRPLSAADRTSLENFIKTWTNNGKKTILTPDEFLNTRGALDELARWDQGKTNLTKLVSRELRKQYDQAGKAQIPELKSLDSQYAPEVSLLKQLKNDIFTANGELKDNAISKIANITGPGKEKLLARVSQVVPDIEQRVRVARAAEDIERSAGVKVGTYTRGAGMAGVAYGLLSGDISALVAGVTAIIAHPEIAVKLLRGLGIAGEYASPFATALRKAANDVNNFSVPGNEMIKNIVSDVHNALLGSKEFKELRMLTDKIVKEGKEGFTYLPDGTGPKIGDKVYAVAPNKSTEFVVKNKDGMPDSDAIYEYLKTHYNDVTSQEGMHFGGWQKDNGDFVLDISKVTNDPAEAADLALKGQQEGIFDFSKGETIYAKDYEKLKTNGVSKEKGRDTKNSGGDTPGDNGSSSKKLKKVIIPPSASSESDRDNM